MLSPQTERRSRSKSPSGHNGSSGRDRSRSRDNRKSSSNSDEDQKTSRRSSKYSARDSNSQETFQAPRYEERKPARKVYEEASSEDDDRYRRRRSRREDEQEEEDHRSRNSRVLKPAENESDEDKRHLSNQGRQSSRRERTITDSDLRYEDDHTSYSRQKNVNSYGSTAVPGAFPHQSASITNHAQAPPASAYSQRPQIHPKAASYGGTNPYADVGKYQYAKPEDFKHSASDSKRQPSFSKAYDVVDIKPGASNDVAARGKAQVDQRYQVKESDRPQPKKRDSEEWWDQRAAEVQSQPRRESYTRERSRSPNPSARETQLRSSLSRLSVGGALGAASLGVEHARTSNGKPPPSPLLEAYKGTYQSISPMPSPTLAAPLRDDNDLSDLDLESDEEDDPRIQRIKELKREKRLHQSLVATSDIASPRSSTSRVETISPHGSALKLETRRPGMPNRSASDIPHTAESILSPITPKQRKKVSFYDPVDDAKEIADALQGTHRAPKLKPLLRILPGLTTDELILLKSEYKNHAKIGGQGINLSKHIKSRVPRNLGKVMYATSLGQYESDAYWANCFYQQGASRRELLIESLVGRSNQQIREIKDVFKDKRYDDDLEKCMRAELKADKFRMAILLALEERRMMEGEKLELRLVKEDADDLYEALNGPGGESAMIKIIIVRSDTHLREVLRFYEKRYRRNFARDMIDKSRNLVVSLDPTRSH